MKNCRIYSAAAVAMALVVPTVATARDAKYDYVVYGLGNISCGQWLQYRKTPNELGPVSWLLGYITALNTLPGRRDIAEGTDADGMLAWVDNYCKNQPLDPLSHASNSLASELNKRRR